MKDIINMINQYIPQDSLLFLVGFLAGYITRLVIGRFKGVRYSVKNLFRLFH